MHEQNFENWYWMPLTWDKSCCCRDHALVRAVVLDLVTWDCRSWYLWSSWQPVPRIWPVSSQTAWHWGTGFHPLHCSGAFLELQTFRWRVHRLKSPGRVAIQPLLCEGPARMYILKYVKKFVTWAFWERNKETVRWSISGVHSRGLNLSQMYAFIRTSTHWDEVGGRELQPKQSCAFTQCLCFFVFTCSPKLISRSPSYIKRPVLPIIFCRE